MLRFWKRNAEILYCTLLHARLSKIKVLAVKFFADDATQVCHVVITSCNAVLTSRPASFHEIYHSAKIASVSKRH